MQKIAVFVDVQNIYYTTRDTFAQQFDYRALWRSLSVDAEISIANAYAIARADDGQRRFQDALRAIGFEVRLKPFIQRADGSAKGDWDVGIALDMMDAAPLVDKVVLLSGDGDFSLLLDKVAKDHATLTHVFGVRALTAKGLIDSADSFTAIDESWLLAR
jgi:uncharacterized LabA/DUF88 family protein